MLRGNCVLDFVEELRVRQWARRNWVPLNLRDLRWHAVILEEMSDRDRELMGVTDTDARVVPLQQVTATLAGPHFLQSEPVRAGQRHGAADSSDMYVG
jgi:hypothetical protein